MATPEYIDSARQVIAHPDRDRLLNQGGGGGTFDGMEARVRALEDRFEKMDSKLDAIGKDLAYLKGKIDMLPTTLQLGGFVIAVLAIAGLAKYFAP